MEAAQSIDVLPAMQRVLIVGGHKIDVQKELSHCIVGQARRLEEVMDLIRGEQRTDLIIYFSHGPEERLEEQVMAWLIEGFRGKIVVLDTANRIRDADALIEGQVIDDYVSGPVSIHRFISIIKNHLGHARQMQSSRALTTFDLFRNLFERGINAIFFFSEDLMRCLAANLPAEQVTGRNLEDLRGMGLSAICEKDQLEGTTQVIRRASRHYYDLKGNTALVSKVGRRIEAVFSCSWMSFGRSKIVKMEVQTPFSRRRDDPKQFDQRALWKAVDAGIKTSIQRHSPLSLVLVKITGNKPEDAAKEVNKALASRIRGGDSIIRLNASNFAVVLPKTSEEKAEQVMGRLREQVLSLKGFQKQTYRLEIRSVLCPHESFEFMSMLIG